MSNRLFRRVPLLLCLLASARASADCTVPPLLLPVHLRVGADTAHCQYNDLQSAINATNECATIIDITREHTYTNQHLIIDSKPNLTLQGWGDGVTCEQIPGSLDFPPYAPPDSTAPLVTLDGSSSNGRVLSITGNSNVTLRNLTVMRGVTDSSASGGGIDFNGTGSLTLTRSTVSLNSAGYGAGININGNGGAASLTLASDTLVLNNTASTSGGGVRVVGSARLYALQAKTMIGYNHAPNGYGGGIEVIGPARADIGSSGYNGLGVINGNDAAYGGGIDILTFDDDAHAIVRLFTTDPENPVQVRDNFASHTGGAVYLKPLLNLFDFAQAMLCAYDFRIEDNAAVEGAAIYSDADYSLDLARGGQIQLNRSDFFSNEGYLCEQPEPRATLGAVACAADVPCNRIAGNIAQDQNGNPTDGSTVLLQSGGQLAADRTRMSGNAGAHLLREIGDVTSVSASVYFSNCLLADNALSGELVAQTDGDSAFLRLNSCTVAGNAIGAPYAFLTPGYFDLHYTIIDQPGRATVDPAISDGAAVSYVLSNDRSTLPDTVYVDQGEPTFIDAAAGNYHLTPGSEGVDFAPPPDEPHLTTDADLDGNTRVVDLPVTDYFGPMDLGAYELPIDTVLACAIDDTIFCDSFEHQL